MSHWNRSSLVLALLVLLPGCFVVKMQRAAAMSRATHVPHPSDGVDRAPLIVGADGTQYMVVELSAQQACLQVDGTVDPNTLLRTKFELVGLRDADERVKDAPLSQISSIRLLDTSTKQVAYDTVVHDSIKDADGNVVATTDRAATGWATVHASSVEMCFAEPPVRDGTNYLLLRPVMPAVVVGLGKSPNTWAPTRVFMRIDPPRDPGSAMLGP